MTRTILIVIALAAPHLIFAQEEKDESSSAAQANNPLANMTALNFHNYYAPKLNDASNEAYMNTAWIRLAKPFSNGKLLLRASIPLNTIALPSGSIVKATSCLGDINAFLSYNFVSKPAATVGIGPMLTIPTASQDALGLGKWQGGFAFVAFIVKSPVFQFGGLVTWQASFAGDEDRPSLALRPYNPSISGNWEKAHIYEVRLSGALTWRTMLIPYLWHWGSEKS